MVVAMLASRRKHWRLRFPSFDELLSDEHASYLVHYSCRLWGLHFAFFGGSWLYERIACPASIVLVQPAHLLSGQAPGLN